MQRMVANPELSACVAPDSWSVWGCDTIRVSRGGRVGVEWRQLYGTGRNMGWVRVSGACADQVILKVQTSKVSIYGVWVFGWQVHLSAVL